MPRLTPEGELASQARAERFKVIFDDLVARFASPARTSARGLFRARLSLALHCGLSQSAVERWISGTRVPSRRHLAACEEFLTISKQAATKPRRKEIRA